MQAKHLWYNVDIRWVDLKDKLEVLAPTGLTRDDIWRHLFLTKQRKNPYEEGCYTGEDLEDVKRKWEAKKEYFSQYKKDGCRPPCIDLDTALQGFNIDNTAAYQAIEDSKALHARRWQTKEGMYRIKRQALPDVRDAVKTTLERCGPFSLVVLSQRRSQVTPLSGHSDQNASETFSNKLQLNKVQSSLRQTSAKTTQVRSKAKTS